MFYHLTGCDTPASITHQQENSLFLLCCVTRTLFLTIILLGEKGVCSCIAHCQYLLHGAVFPYSLWKLCDKHQILHERLARVNILAKTSNFFPLLKLKHANFFPVFPYQHQCKSSWHLSNFSICNTKLHEKKRKMFTILPDIVQIS